jgi:carboxylesterase
MAKKPYGVLILHGFTSSLDTVREVEPPLKALGLPTRMPILRGHCAASPEALRGVTWQDWVADAETAYRDLLKEVDKVIIVGLSMGGLVTLDLAAVHPDTTDSIILAAAALQLASPLAPGRPLSFLRPVVKLLLKKWDTPPNYADKSLEQYNTNYLWAPMDSVMELLKFSKHAQEILPKVTVPALILQSHKDTTVMPQSAETIYRGISTPLDQKKIVWFETTEHEMFRDCERPAAIQVLADYIRGRIKPAKQAR